jgi:endonuclease/exonuclease/phosphatase family metal-dependent hydrolase
MTKTTKYQQPNPETETRKKTPEPFRVVTYNIHKGRGMDRRNRIQRVAEILQGLKPDIVALQEVLSVESKEPEAHQARFIAEALGFHFRIGETRRLKGGAYGNVTLSLVSSGNG